MSFGGIRFIVKDAQEQRRTPVIGHYFARREKAWTRKKRQGRKCSRRQWKARNRVQWVRIPIYDEPTDVLMLNGTGIVTPRQYQALKQEIDRRNQTAPDFNPSIMGAAQ